MNNQSSYHGVWHDGIGLVRVLVGILLIHHGLQVFYPADMTHFGDRLTQMSIPYAEAWAYTGKIIELAGGLLLVLGLFTRLVTVLLFLTFIFITFVYGEGKVFGENQFPFLYSLISLLFFFAGPGRLSIDHILFMNKREHKRDDPEAVSKKFGRYVSKS